MEVEIHFGGSGKVLSDMEMAKQGDVYIPGSPDFMEKAIEDGVVYNETQVVLAYLIPAIIVKRGNPKNISSLADLANPGIRVGIAEPETVCVGLYGVEILKKAGLYERVKGNIVTRAESCSKTAAILQMDSVDAVLGWRIFEKWNPELEAVMLKPEEIPRIAYIPAAISVYTHNRREAERFLSFLATEGRRIYRRHGYIVEKDVARSIAPQAVIGGMPDEL